jgi:hypothetical protein
MLGTGLPTLQVRVSECVVLSVPASNSSDTHFEYFKIFMIFMSPFRQMLDSIVKQTITASFYIFPYSNYNILHWLFYDAVNVER